MKNVFKLSVLCLALTSCMTNPFIENEFVEQKHELVKKLDNDQEFFSQAERNETLEYVIEVDRPYFAVSVPKLTAPSFLEKQLPLKLKEDELNGLSIYALLMENFNGKVEIEPNVFDIENPPKRINYNGTAESALNYLCHVFDCHWSFDNSVLKIQSMMVKDWDLSFVPSTFELSAQMQSTSGGSNSEGGGEQSNITSTGGQNAKFSLKGGMTKLEEIKQAAMAFKTEKGVITMAEGSSILVVKDKPSVIDNIDRIIKREEMKSSQIVVKVDVIQVQYNNNLDLGLEISGVFNDLSNGNTLSNSIGSVVGQTANTLGMTVTDPASRFFDSSALVKAIDERLSVVNSYSTYEVTLNNQPLIFQDGENVIYEDFDVTSTANVGTLFASEVKQLPIGLDISVLPIIKNKDEILIHLNYFNNEVIGQFQRSSINGGPPTFFPQTTDKKSMKSFYVQDGYPLVVTSKVRKQKSTNRKSFSFDKGNQFQAEILILTAKIMRNYNVTQG